MSFLYDVNGSIHIAKTIQENNHSGNGMTMSIMNLQQETDPVHARIYAYAAQVSNNPPFSIGDCFAFDVQYGNNNEANSTPPIFTERNPVVSLVETDEQQQIYNIEFKTEGGTYDYYRFHCDIPETVENVVKPDDMEFISMDKPQETHTSTLGITSTISTIPEYQGGRAIYDHPDTALTKRNGLVIELDDALLGQVAMVTMQFSNQQNALKAPLVASTTCAVSIDGVEEPIVFTKSDTEGEDVMSGDFNRDTNTIERSSISINCPDHLAVPAISYTRTKELGDGEEIQEEVFFPKAELIINGKVFKLDVEVRPVEEDEVDTSEATESTSEATESTSEATESTSEATESTSESTESTSEATESTSEATESTSEATESTSEATESTSEATESTSEATESTSEATESTSESTESTSEATESTSEATESTSEATESTSESTESTSEATESTSEATESTSEATESTSEATESTSEATESTSEATESTSESTESTSEATESTSESTESTSEATESTSESTESTSEATESTSESTESTSESTESTSEATESTSEATESTSESTESTSEATESTSEATESTSEATESTSESTSESTESTSEATESTSEATESTSEATESTSEATESTSEPTTDSTDSITDEVNDALTNSTSLSSYVLNSAIVVTLTATLIAYVF